MDFAPPKPGDIVECRFPKSKIAQPGPKPRPALVLEVERFPDGSCDVVVAYGTSQGANTRYQGEFTLLASEPGAGLAKDTKFDLRQSAKLPFDDEWFEVAPGQPFGPHPKRGKLDLANFTQKRKLQAAVSEARQAGVFDFIDAGSSKRRLGRKS